MNRSTRTGKGVHEVGSRYLNHSQQTLLRVLGFLIERPVEDISTARLMEQVGLPRDQAFRAMENLRYAGWAERTPDGRHRLSPKITRLAECARVAIQQLYREHLDTGQAHHD